MPVLQQLSYSSDRMNRLSHIVLTFYILTSKKLFCSSFHVLSRTVGCNLFKRLAINALLAIASLFTKEKVLQRVLFATMDDVLKEVNEVRSYG